MHVAIAIYHACMHWHAARIIIIIVTANSHALNFINNNIVMLVPHTCSITANEPINLLSCFLLYYQKFIAMHASLLTPSVVAIAMIQTKFRDVIIVLHYYRARYSWPV